MKTCPNCHAPLNEETDFCTSCGGSLKDTPVNNQQPKKRTPKKGKSFIWIALLVVILVSLLTSYQLLAKKYSQEATEENFKEALLSEDKESLKKLIQPSDSRMKINDESLEALFALIESEQSILYEMTDQLTVFVPNDGSFYLKVDGKHFGIFDRYVIDAEGYYIDVYNTSAEETTITLNDKEVTILEEDEESKEIGPFLTGSYLLKGISDEDGEKSEDMTNIKLTGLNTRSEVVFDTEIIEEKELEEVDIHSEENNSPYILAYSNTTYINESDLYNLTSEELQIARNEIYARHGYVFETKKLQNYFNSLDWYNPDVNFDGVLSELEKTNAELIKSFE